jgi:DNA invertase Pin-like site-specific DNA recombinase
MSKNRHAVALGRLGGKARTRAKIAAARTNGKLGGGQFIYPRGTTGAQRYHLRNIAAQGGKVITDAQQKALDAVERLRKKESAS